MPNSECESAQANTDPMKENDEDGEVTVVESTRILFCAGFSSLREAL